VGGPALDHSQNCKDLINAAPGHAVVKGSLHALLLWGRENKPPPKSPPESGDPAAPGPVARDKFGNAKGMLTKGGIRLPEVEVPAASVNGLANSPAGPKTKLNFCRLFGTTVPFEEDTLSRLDPTHVRS
jgi:hypothetical protein